MPYTNAPGGAHLVGGAGLVVCQLVSAYAGVAADVRYSDVGAVAVCRRVQLPPHVDLQRALNEVDEGKKAKKRLKRDLV